VTESPKAIEILNTEQLIDVGNSEFVTTIGECWDLLRDDGTPNRAGDVLSVQEDGTLQTRPAGTDGPFERAKPDDEDLARAKLLIYRPNGPLGRTFTFGLTHGGPNP
jgi:hypothetical protein